MWEMKDKEKVWKKILLEDEWDEETLRLKPGAESRLLLIKYRYVKPALRAVISRQKLAAEGK